MLAFPFATIARPLLAALVAPLLCAAAVADESPTPEKPHPLDPVIAWAETRLRMPKR